MSDFFNDGKKKIEAGWNNAKYKPKVTILDQKSFNAF